MKKRACSAFLALCLMLTLAVPLAAAAEPEQEPPGEEASWTVSKSKIAENLDEQYRSRITLSLPSAEETLAADVVFVLDKSSCKAETAASAEALLRQVLVGAGSDACVNVGVVVFAGSAVEALPLTRASEENLQALYDAVAQRPDGLRPGTNLPSGLLAGEEMLAASATADRRKHLILISDGATYLFCKDGDYTTPYTRISAHRDGEVQGGGNLYEWPAKYGVNQLGSSAADSNAFQNGIPENWDEFFVNLNTIRTNYAKYDQEYKRDSSGSTEYDPDNLLPADDPQAVINVEESLAQTAEIYQRLSSRYHCCAVYNRYDQTNATVFNSFMDYLSGGRAAELGDSVRKEILYLLSAGSTVEDYMGETEEYNFDFVNDPAALTLTVGEGEGMETYPAATLGENHYGFCPMELPEERSAEPAAYAYELIYTPGEQSGEEHFSWQINVPVSNFAPVRLTYSVELKNPKTAAGTYGVFDANGDGLDENGVSLGEVDGLYTNLSATLYPMDSLGEEGAAEPFARPTVSYTVASPTPTPVYPIYYTLTYVSNGGTEYPQERYSAGTRVALEKLPYRDGYTFTGWYGDAALTKKLTEVTMTENKTVYAGWRQRTAPDLLNSEDHVAYVIGYEDGTVRPGGSITRAETATIFFRLLTDAVRDGNLTDRNEFSDVRSDQWFCKAISTMSKLGLVTGRANGAFDPNASITRGEFAAICARFDTEAVGSAPQFTDISGHWAEKDILRAAALGWVTGYGDGSFRPDQPITRAEAMTLINRVLCRIPQDSSDLLTAQMLTWPDNAPGAWYYLAVQEATNSHDHRAKGDVYESWTAWHAAPAWIRYQH